MRATTLLTEDQQQIRRALDELARNCHACCRDWRN